MSKKLSLPRANYPRINNTQISRKNKKKIVPNDEIKNDTDENNKNDKNDKNVKNVKNDKNDKNDKIIKERLISNPTKRKREQPEQSFEKKKKSTSKKCDEKKENREKGEKNDKNGKSQKSDMAEKKAKKEKRYRVNKLIKHDITKAKTKSNDEEDVISSLINLGDIITIEFKKDFYNIRTHLIEMLRDRGYDIKMHMVGEDEYLQNFATFLKKDINITIKKRNDNDDDIKIFFIMNRDSMDIGVDIMRKIFVEIKKHNILHAIIIVDNKLTNNAKQEVNEIEEKKSNQLKIEFFLTKELRYNITKHVKQSIYTVLNDEKKMSVCKIFKSKHMEHILSKDPIARYYALKPGDILECRQKSENAGLYIKYRICISRPDKECIFNTII